LCALGIQRLYLLLQTAQELPGLMALEFKLLSQPFNISLLHWFVPTFMRDR
jgi:hypothetical protein